MKKHEINRRDLINMAAAGARAGALDLFGKATRWMGLLGMSASCHERTSNLFLPHVECVSEKVGGKNVFPPARYASRDFW